jgi:hypothetical protein
MDYYGEIHKILKSDPLGELSRKERTMLLLISIITIAISRAGLVPTKIVGFGIEFANIDRSAILWLLAASVLYFFVTFLSHAVPDFVSWQTRYKKYSWELAHGPDLEDPDFASDTDKERWTEYHRAEDRFEKVTFFRIGLDFVVPIVVGVTAIIVALISL